MKQYKLTTSLIVVALLYDILLPKGDGTYIGWRFDRLGYLADEYLSQEVPTKEEQIFAYSPTVRSPAFLVAGFSEGRNMSLRELDDIGLHVN